MDFVGALLIGAVASTIFDANESLKIDDQALRKYAMAFEKEAEARLSVQKAEEHAKKRLANVAKKKRAVINVTVPRFVDVYNKIQKIEIEHGDRSELVLFQGDKDKIDCIYDYSVIPSEDVTDKALLCGMLTKSVGRMMIEDSKRNLSAAQRQMSVANGASSQAKSMVTVYEAIAERSDRTSRLLISMNVCFLKSIEKAEKVIEKNGLDIRSYSEFDKAVLMNCVNFALAMSDLIDVPVVDENGRLCEEAVELLVKGEKYLEKIQNI